MTEKPTRFIEMDWREALRKYAAGYDVLRMDVEPRPGQVAPDYITDSAGSTEDQPSGQKSKARRQYINAEDKEAITELYKAGREMEEIADVLGLYLSAVSRYIKEAGLGDERYKGKAIPSTGSAPVTAAVYNGGTGKKSN